MKKLNSVYYILIPVFLVFGTIFLFWLLSAQSSAHQLLLTDRWAFLWINGFHANGWDQVMYDASDKVFWLPFYAIIVFMLIREYRQNCWKILLTIFLLILTADQVSSSLIKDLFKRLRPSHEPDLLPLIHLSKAGAGGLYGFVSSHAANSFALATFLSLLLSEKYRYLKYLLFAWALIVSYSRVYNGVHYPGDVLIGALIGSGLGFLFNYGYRKIFNNKLYHDYSTYPIS